MIKFGKQIFLLLCYVVTANVLFAQHRLWLGDDLDFETLQILPQNEVKHVKVRTASLPCTFLIGCAIEEYKGVLYASWATGPEGIGENSPYEHVRVKRSIDEGITWQDEKILAPVVDGKRNHSHGSFWSIKDTLNFFASNFLGHFRSEVNGRKTYNTDVYTERFYLDEVTGTWVSKGKVIDDFFPMDEPRLMPNGNYIMAGFDQFHQVKVSISNKENASEWKTVLVPQELLYGVPEPTALVLKDKIVLVIRNYARPDDGEHFCISESSDNGKTWTTVGLSNLYADQTKPYAGVLSNGLSYLVSTLHDREWINISLGYNGHFEKIFRLRKGKPGYRTYFKAGKSKTPREWAYPYCIEYNKKLYITYHQNKLDAELTIIPIKLLTETLEQKLKN